MLVQCPNCLTNYKVSDSLITTPSPTLRCSRCKHIFILGAKADGTANSETPTAPPYPSQPEDERELSFSFP
ncbi:MAG: zinc-ribbon domain-containing protein, partial [Candidatus Binatia bacterium]